MRSSSRKAPIRERVREMQSNAKKQGPTIEWLQTRQMHRILYETAKHFSKSHKNDPYLTKLGLIQTEIWMARQTLQPFPHISVARNRDGSVVGVMCGFPCFYQFFIQHIAIHPDFSHVHDKIGEQLISSAIDESTVLGFLRWVACSPPPEEEEFWRSHRFYKETKDLFRRMGYFVNR